MKNRTLLYYVSNKYKTTFIHAMETGQVRPVSHTHKLTVSIQVEKCLIPEDLALYVCSVRICQSHWLGLSIGLRSFAVLFGSEGDLVQDELWDWVGERRCHGQHVRLGLETILVGDELDLNVLAFRGSIAVGAKCVLDKAYNTPPAKLSRNRQHTTASRVVLTRTLHFGSLHPQCRRGYHARTRWCRCWSSCPGCTCRRPQE